MAWGEQIQHVVWICKPQEASRHLLGNMFKFVTHMWKACLWVASVNQICLAMSWISARWCSTSQVFAEEKTWLASQFVEQPNKSGPQSIVGSRKFDRKAWRETSLSDLGWGSLQPRAFQALATLASIWLLKLWDPSLPKTWMRGSKGVQLSNQKLVVVPLFTFSGKEPGK